MRNRFTKSGLHLRPFYSCLVLVLSVFTLTSCFSEKLLPAPDKPFDPSVTHLPETIEPGKNVIFVTADDDIEARLQTILNTVKPGTTIVLPEGKHQISSELVVNTPYITIVGMGMDKTELDFSQQESGAQGILSLGDYFTIKDLAILDAAGDGIRAEGADGVVIRRLRVEWTNGPDSENGAYGVYPILSKNVLVEDCIVKGASDAGIYVGQSQNIIVRRNTVEYNVAGIEIENSVGADVYDNWTAYNTGGILVFSLPNLVLKNGSTTRVFDNVVFQNSTKNFAPEGNIVGIVPSGTGMLVLANDFIEVFNNQIRNNQTVSVAIVSYLITENKFDDPLYDPYPETIYIHDNLIERPIKAYFDGSQMNLLVNGLYGFFRRPAEILYDGLGEVANGNTELPPEKKICVKNNITHKDKPPRFGNLHLENPGNDLIPGGPVTEDEASHDCEHESLPAVELPAFPPMPDFGEEYTDEEVLALCNGGGEGINFAATVVDCPNVADYNLWPDPSNPLSGENANGLPFDLTTPLFSDYAYKYRQIFVPEGEEIVYSDDEFAFPIGTIITKNFYYPDNFNNPTVNRMIETRLLIRRQQGWQRLVYIWENGVAKISQSGGRQNISWIHYDGTERSTKYEIPSPNQCSSCHGPAATDRPLGPKALSLNKMYEYADGKQNQLLKWTQAGILRELPSDLSLVPTSAVWDDPESGTLEERARAYLEINCAHCHSEGGRAESTGLWLKADAPLDANAGLCKSPIAAGPGTGGLQYDIVPGNADESILPLRVNSVDPAIKMPELGKSVIHQEGVDLIKSWIDSMSGNCEL